MALFTIGYEAAGFPGLLAALQRQGVRTLIDVRDLPLSRRAGFSKTPLSAGLTQAGIAYLHLKALGTPKEGRLAAHRGDMGLFWQIVETALARPEADHALARAAALAGGTAGPVCLLCVEASPLHCHRLRVAERVAGLTGLDIHHLAPDPGF